jgi:putative membrane protein
MSQRLERALKGLILIGFALFLTNSIMNGTLLFYINRRFAWLTWVATVLLVLIAFAYQRTTRVRHRQDQDHGDVHHHHDHCQGSESVWTALALVALPLLLGVLVPPQPLGAQAVGGREVNTDGVGLDNDEAVLARAATERDILDWLRAFSAAENPAALSGQEARVVGFVYRDDTFTDELFMVSRFVVSCCVADATAVGLIVSWPGSRGLPLDSWVEVHGVFQQAQLEGELGPILVADDVRPTNPPNQPYLYP